MEQLPSQPTPIFYVDYSIGGVQENIQAGKEEYYMFTSARVDSFSVPNLVGSLMPEDGMKKKAFEFKFRGNSTLNNNLDSVFQLGTKELLDTHVFDASNTRVRVKFDANDVDNVNKYLWKINTNIPPTGLKSPERIFDINEDNNFPTTLQTFFDTGCVSTTTRCINFNHMGCYGDYDFTFNGGGLNYTFKPTSQYEADVASVIWYVNHNKVAETKVFDHTFSVPGNYLISADIFFKNGCMSCVSKRVAIDVNYPGGGCFSDFSIEYEPLNSPKYLQLNKLELSYWDENGMKYSSVNCGNPGSIEIIESELYKENESGKRTQRVKLKGDITLYNKHGDRLSVSLNEVQIAVAVEE
jgi:hypothetical protein